MLRIGLIDDSSPQEPADVFTCPICGKEYKSADGLAKHIKKEHPDAADESGADDDSSPQE